MLERKNIQDKKFILGQFNTPPHICRLIVSQIDFKNALIIEPSFGSGNFITALSHLPNEKIGLELDADIFSKKSADTNTKLLNKNFYDFNIVGNKRLIFIGNPPYRTPAYSLATHKGFISKLTKKYNVLGIREEAVFFILHTIDIIRANGGYGEMHYIIPTAILKNNSKFFTRFKEFLREQCWFRRITSINGTDFDGVNQDLACVSLEVKPNIQQAPSLFFDRNLEPCNNNDQDNVIVDGHEVSLDKYLCLETTDTIQFQQIFKQTYLGSVPCESLLMSVIGEPRDHFQRRLCGIISDHNITSEKLYDLLQYNGRFHLKVFDAPKNTAAVQKKLKIILSYVKNIQEKYEILQEFMNMDNYKEINGRNGSHYYFRCNKLKKNKNFVYELNPNPCKSFYFTGNPSHSSTDYFGFCGYDINRNVSPGANRTVPVDNIDDNLTDYFKGWWHGNTDEPLSEVFNYIIFVANTPWYKQMKRNNKRFYFAIPAEFIPREQRYLKKAA